MHIFLIVFACVYGITGAGWSFSYTFAAGLFLWLSSAILRATFEDEHGSLIAAVLLIGLLSWLMLA